MLLTLTRNIIVNTGNGGKPRKIGENIEVSDNEGRALIAGGSAKPIAAKTKE